MNPFAALWNIFRLLKILLQGGLGERKRILEGITNSVRARIEDTQVALSCIPIQQSKKRKRHDDQLFWVTKGRELVKEAKTLLGQVIEACPEKNERVEGESIFSSQTWEKLVVINKLINTLSAHEKEADVLFRCAFSDKQSPDHGNIIPVTNIFGQQALDALDQLQVLLRSDEIGRIYIHGIEGIGKTFLMKHLHNCVLKWAEPEKFEFVVWVTIPRQFSIERVQDAVAAALKCDLHSDDDLNVRAKTLSDMLARLGSFVLFLDNVPEARVSDLDRIGISVPAAGSKSKVVITTRLTYVSEMLDSFGTVKLDRLSDEEACELLMNEASPSGRMRCDSMLNSIPGLLANLCHGVPRTIVDIATCMRGIDDPREWKNVLFELGRTPISGDINRA
ncbi:probable disease resistance protein At4g27220 [Beta vulgaris subsp. vulgaris]|uniref:probable disease resistance protein At4g27220 n=1 Tax=Beta vulgaris subsp. vulgaris TaxID=3555 RepID=UPI00053F9214|nr:probable disease resistance protein At4g27220 [Beta vulgaris subsp. vulgaris]